VVGSNALLQGFGAGMGGREAEASTDDVGVL